VSGPPAELVFQEFPTFVYTHAPTCHDCSRVDSPSGAHVAAGTTPPTFDVSKALDGGIVASEAFRLVCSDVPGIEFEPLGGLEGHWLVEVSVRVRIDPFESRVHMGPTCSTCGRPRYVTRSGAIRLLEDELLPSGFSGTDVLFGDTADFGSTRPIRLRPHILVDRSTARLLKSTSLLGIHLITQP